MAIPPPVRSWPWTCAVPGLGFLVVTLLVWLGWLWPVDRAVVAWVAGWRDCSSIALATALSALGAGEVSLLLTAVIAAICLLRRQPRAAASLLLLYLSVPVELGLKLALAQPLAGLLFPIPAACEWYHPALSALTPYSYPSGYAIRVTYFVVLAGVWLLGQRSPLAAPAARGFRARRPAIGILTAALFFLLASRLVLSWHWPSDLIGGVLLGTALAVATLHIGWPMRTPAGSGRAVSAWTLR